MPFFGAIRIPSQDVGPAAYLQNLPPRSFVPPKRSPSRGSITSYRPNFAQTLRDKAADALTGLGLKRAEAGRLAGKITSFASDFTPAGDAMSAVQAGESFAKGRKTEGVLNALAAIIGSVPIVGDAAAAGLKKGIRAYHGSPHDFDKFSLSKIGTGEGAQAYGHGLYFAENEKVAREYRDQLSRNVTIDGRPYYDFQQQHFKLQNPLADSTLVSAGGDIDSAIAKVNSNSHLWSKAQRQRIGLDEAVSELEALRGRVDNSVKGRLYEVNINADPNSLLDWDKALGEQARLDNLLALARETRATRGIGLEDPAGAYYQGISNALGPYPGSLQGRRAATTALSQAGVPGIKYLDQGSRQAGDGSRNFVIFDDSLIDILKKY